MRVFASKLIIAMVVFITASAVEKASGKPLRSVATTANTVTTACGNTDGCVKCATKGCYDYHCRADGSCSITVHPFPKSGVDTSGKLGVTPPVSAGAAHVPSDGSTKKPTTTAAPTLTNPGLLGSSGSGSATTTSSKAKLPTSVGGATAPHTR
jgi:hypothetical protein